MVIIFMVTSYLELEQKYTIIYTIKLEKGRKNVYFIKHYNSNITSSVSLIIHKCCRKVMKRK